MKVEFDVEKAVPRTMSTQHPDNVNIPGWSSGEVIDSDAEIFETFYAFDELGCQEVMWDSEGKDADTRVVRKLLNRYGSFFSSHVLGRDVFLTYRITNPKIELVERKVVIETLQNIPVAFDVASSFYGRDVAPIFEVILPFTTGWDELVTLFNYYRKAVAAEDMVLNGSTRVRDWVGSFKPKSIRVIPLVEDYGSLLDVDKIVEPYIEAVKPESLRVFIARSDPALNYGLFCAVLLSKVALSKLGMVAKEKGVSVYPIIGVGSKPFRGHLAPDNVARFLQEYRGLATVTVQSALRYDYPVEQVKECVRFLNENLPNGEAVVVPDDEEAALRGVLAKCRRRYEDVVELLAPLVNGVAAYVPQRRARKLHIGLFGYSRCVAGVCLPRAITFSAALYSIGLPPEFIGCNVLGDLSDKELELVSKHYVNVKYDLGAVGGFVSWQNANMLLDMHEKAAERAGADPGKLKVALGKVLGDLQAVEETFGVKLGPLSLNQKRHENFANNFLLAWLEGEHDEAKKALVESARLRNCLG